MRDEDILNLLLSRDENALNEIITKYGDYYHSIAYQILHSHEDAEECVDSALVQIWENKPPEGLQNLKGYIGTAVRNASLSRLRMNQAEKRGAGENSILLSELEETIPSGNNVEQAVERIFLAEMIRKWLENEKQINRRLFLGRYWYGYEYRDLSAFYGISQTKIRVTLHRMRKRLRMYLEQEDISV